VRGLYTSGRSSDISQTFGLLQRSFQHNRQHRLPNKSDGVTGQKCKPCRFILVSAQKDAPERLLRVNPPSRINAAATAMGAPLCNRAVSGTEEDMLR
jgi:hypothetical protein